MGSSEGRELFLLVSSAICDRKSLVVRRSGAQPFIDLVIGFGRKIAVGTGAGCLSTSELCASMIAVRRGALQGLRALILEHLGLVWII